MVRCAPLLLLLAVAACARPDVRLLSPTAMVAGPEGRLAVADGVLAGVVALGPSGLRGLLTGRGRGAGPPLAEPEAMVGGDRLVVADAGRLLAVDWATGDREELSGPGRGRGPALRRPVALARGDAGLLVLDEEAVALVRVDPASGDREEVSGPGRGQGERWRQPAGLAARGDEVLVVDAALGNLVRVDPATGDRAEVADGLREPEAVAFGDQGTAWVADIDGDRLLRVDLATGRVEELPGSGPPLLEPHDLVVRPGEVLVLEMASRSVLRVDPATGARTVLFPGD